MAHGLPDLRDMPLGDFCDFVWYMMTRGAQEEDVEKMRAQMWQPAKGEVVNDPRSPWSPENEKKALSAFKSGMGGAPTAA